jgi:short-subunit dehydrogenase
MAKRRFQGKTVVVTGASSGVGAAVARRFAAEGAKVVLAARSAEALEQVAKEIGQAALAVPTDVADPAAAAALLEKAEWAFGGLHVLVNNAAVNHRGPVEEMDPGNLAQIVDVNLRAPVVLTRLALPHIRKAGGGAIVNVASIAGQVPLPGEATYSATKFGLRGFSYALADELRGSGITVSVVSPGPLDTGFLLDDLEEAPDLVFSQPMSSADQVAALVLDCAADGRVERTLPQLSGKLATMGYLFPALARALRPLLEAQGRRTKAKLRARR